MNKMILLIYLIMYLKQENLSNRVFLNGYNDEINNVARLTVKQIELTEDEKQRLNFNLNKSKYKITI